MLIDYQTRQKFKKADENEEDKSKSTFFGAGKNSAFHNNHGGRGGRGNRRNLGGNSSLVNRGAKSFHLKSKCKFF